MAHFDDTDTRRANASYVSATMRTPLLSREEEQALAVQWRDQRNQKALHRLVTAYARLVVSTASKFRNYGLPAGDLIQEGNVGLMMAAEKFDPDRDVRFSTYATWWIRSAMQDYVLRNSSIVRTGTTAAQKTLFFNLRRLRAKLPEGPDGALTEDGRREIAETLGVKLREVEAMERHLAASDQSLNVTVNTDSDNPWQDFLPDDRPSPEESTIHRMDRVTRTQWLQEAMGELTDREQLIIQRRRLSEDGVTLEQLGLKLGVSKERVRQLEHRAMNKLRNAIQRKTARPDDLYLSMA